MSIPMVVLNEDIKSFSKEELVKIINELGQPSFRANQVFDWLYGNSSQQINTFDKMTNLPLSLRKQLSSSFFINSLTVKEKHTSIDNTVKYIFSSNDGVSFETVAIPDKKQDLNNHKRDITVCVSTQAGCKMKCSFCATGRQKFYRNLNIGEIVDQVNFVAWETGHRISNVVVMGQGEPFNNYQAIISALKILNEKKFLNIAARKITVSTCGIINGIKNFSNEQEQFGLAISLHSCIQKTRNKIMPGVRSQSLNDLRSSIKRYIEKTNRRPTFEYMLLKGVNDKPEDLGALIKFCKGLLCHVNLLKYNNIKGCKYQASNNKKLQEWKQELINNKIAVSIRESRGADISGACGQLINK